MRKIYTAILGICLILLSAMLTGYLNITNAQKCEVSNIIVSNASSTPETKIIKYINTKQLSQGVMLEEAFISFCTCGSKYEPLAFILLQSLHEFSTRPLVMYWVDCEPQFNVTQFPRLINRHITSCPIHNAFAKIKAILLGEIKYAVYIDVDNVVNTRIDDLFDMCRRFAHKYPLLPRHALDAYDQAPSMARLGVTTKSIPYGHASTFLYSYESMPFFMDTYEQVLLGTFKGQQFTDETAINVMLWKFNVTEQMCIYDMFYYDSLGIYNSQSPTMPYGNYHALGDLGTDTPLAALTMHGEKNPDDARRIFQFFKEERNKFAYFNGQHWSNDWQTGARGCLCGPDKKCDLFKPND